MKRAKRKCHIRPGLRRHDDLDVVTSDRVENVPRQIAAIFAPGH